MTFRPGMARARERELFGRRLPTESEHRVCLHRLVGRTRIDRRVDVADADALTTGRTRPEDPAVQEVRWVDRDEVLRLPLHPPIAKYLSTYQPGTDFQYFGSLWAP